MVLQEKSCLSLIIVTQPRGRIVLLIQIQYHFLLYYIQFIFFHVFMLSQSPFQQQVGWSLSALEINRVSKISARKKASKLSWRIFQVLNLFFILSSSSALKRIFSFRRIPINKNYLDVVIGHLRTDDIYHQIATHPHPDHRSTALAQQVSLTL